MSSFIVGLTGGIASGKSEVSRRFEALGVYVADADIAARRVVEPGPTLDRIAVALGPNVIGADGQLNRGYVRELVFGDADKRKQLEAITHPAIRQLLHDECHSASSCYAIAVIPLLAEAGGKQQYPWLDRIAVVDTSRATQHRRLTRRDTIDDALAERMIVAQATREQRLAIADDVITNDGEPEQMDIRILALHQQWLGLAKAAE